MVDCIETLTVNHSDLAPSNSGVAPPGQHRRYIRRPTELIKKEEEEAKEKEKEKMNIGTAGETTAYKVSIIYAGETVVWLQAYKRAVEQSGGVNEYLLPGLNLTHEQLFYLNFAQVGNTWLLHIQQLD